MNSTRICAATFNELVDRNQADSLALRVRASVQSTWVERRP